MRVHNLHERSLRATSIQVWDLIASLGSANDRLWPVETWPRMKLDRALGVGASGGHGPIRYAVDAYSRESGVVRFRFTAPRGFVGAHRFELRRSDDRTVLLRHVLDMRTTGWARLTWPLIFRPLHDALVEDGLARAETEAGMTPRIRTWSPWVKLLRRLIAGANAPRQTLPRPLSPASLAVPANDT